ncbi:MAG: hypothetical protein IJN88_07680 [Clostridia bacterium]|nr:hypothetical protein [Clostridia bacterium]
MKKFLNRWGFRKTDEMQQYIAFKAQRNALIFLLLALSVWTLYESYKVFAFHTMLNPLPCFLLTGASCIQFFSEAVMSHNAVKGDEDSPKASGLSKTLLLCTVVAVITAIIASAVVLLLVMK